MNYTNLPNDEILNLTSESLKSNNIDVYVVDDSASAHAKVLSLIPHGSEVMTMTSVTLDQVGLSETINNSENYVSVKNKLGTMNDDKDVLEKQRIGAAPEYVLGSVHAITQDGQIVIVSNTGSQLPAYAYGSQHVIWVVGAQKIVDNLDNAMKRIYDHVLPLESVRVQKAYGMKESSVNKVLIVNREVVSGRITIVLVKESLGY